MISALVLAASLMASAAPPPDEGGEPLPPGAPTGGYQLSAWCYGALKEYLDIYERVKPELVDINRMFGEPVQEAEPYQADMNAYRVELKMIGGAVTLAEQASPRPIAAQGAQALRQGVSIWSIAELKTRRELARAWLLWSLPDRCDSVSRDLAAKSALLGRALTYNTPKPQPASTDSPPEPTSAVEAGQVDSLNRAAFAAPKPPPPGARLSLTPQGPAADTFEPPPAELPGPVAPLPEAPAPAPAPPVHAYAAPPPPPTASAAPSGEPDVTASLGSIPISPPSEPAPARAPDANVAVATAPPPPQMASREVASPQMAAAPAAPVEPAPAPPASTTTAASLSLDDQPYDPVL